MRQLTVREVGDYYADRKRGRKPKLQIRLEGRWLSDLNFHNGDKVLVMENEGTLVLSRSEPVAVCPYCGMVDSKSYIEEHDMCKSCKKTNDHIFDELEEKAWSLT